MATSLRQKRSMFCLRMVLVPLRLLDEMSNIVSFCQMLECTQADARMHKQVLECTQADARMHPSRYCKSTHISE